MAIDRFLDDLASAYKGSLGTNDNLTQYLLSIFREIGVVRTDGGPGSGNWGHEGRPGEVGGSAPSDEAKSETVGIADPKYLAVSMTKRRANERISSVLGNKDPDFDRRQGLYDILDDLHPGTKIKMPDTWQNDDGSPTVYIKDDVGGASRWYMKYEGEKYYMPETELADYMLSEYDNFDGNLCEVISSATSAEEKKSQRELWEDRYNWRRNATVWQKDGSFDQKATIHMQKFDLDNCGDRFEITGSDGRTYIKVDYLGGWVDKETYQKADRRKLKNPEFTGDFFDVNFGMNGVSKDECTALRVFYSSMTGAVRKEYENRFRSATCNVQNSQYGVSHCDQYGDVWLTHDSSAETVLHEYSHSADRYYEAIDSSPSVYIDKIGAGPLQPLEDFQAMAKTVGYTLGGDGDIADEHPEQIYWSWAREKSKTVYGFENVSDAISALTGSSCGEAVYGSHEQSYWYKRSSRTGSSTRATEFWAEYCTMRICGQTEALSLLQQVAPNMYKACEKTYKEVFSDAE